VVVHRDGGPPSWPGQAHHYNDVINVLCVEKVNSEIVNRKHRRRVRSLHSCAKESVGMIILKRCQPLLLYSVIIPAFEESSALLGVISVVTCKPPSFSYGKFSYKCTVAFVICSPTRTNRADNRERTYWHLNGVALDAKWRKDVPLSFWKFCQNVFT